MTSKKKSDKTTSTEKLLGIIRSKSSKSDNNSPNQPHLTSEPLPSVEKRLKKGTSERQTIQGTTGNLDHPDNTSTERLLGTISSKSPQIDNSSQDQPYLTSELLPSVEKKLEDGTIETQTIQGTTGNFDHP